MQAALENVAGVKDVTVDFATSSAVVTAQDGKSVDTAALLKALADTQYKDSRVKDVKS